MECNFKFYNYKWKLFKLNIYIKFYKNKILVEGCYERNEVL